MSNKERTLLRLHVEAVWGVQIPREVQADIVVLPGGVQPSWQLLVAELSNGSVHIWHSDVIDRDRESLLKRANEAIMLPSTEAAAPGIIRGVALHLAAQPALDVIEAQKIALPLTSDDQSLVKAFQDEVGGDFLDVEKRPLVGVIMNGRLVSLAHSSRRTAEACELGVDTLPDARRRGYALAVTVMWTQMVLQEGLVPLYSALADNTASLALAAAAGYRVFARAATIKG